MEPQAHLSPEQLLEHTGWMRELARSLVRDDAVAEDVVQETCIAFLKRPPRDVAAIRAWLARVVHNLSGRFHREEGNRRRRETLVARERQETHREEDVLARAELQRKIVEQVLGLEDPWRSTLLLRYFEQLSFDEISSRHGIPVSTVKSRVKRALETLRSRLNRLDPAGREPWCSALLPLAFEKAVAPAGAGATTGTTLSSSLAAPAAALSTALKTTFACAAGALIVSMAIGAALLRSTSRAPLESSSAGPALLGFSPLGPNKQGLHEYRHERSGIVFVLLPGGSFSMGSSADERGAQASEQPRHDVSVKPFLIAKREVSQAEWGRVLETNPAPPDLRGPDLPVTMVSWLDCQEFCKRVGLRLPTEAEWEYACRAGTSTAYAFGEDLTESQAALAGEKHVPVDSLEPNAFGLQSMHGNVSEFCEDEYDEAFYGRAEARGPDPLNGTPYFLLSTRLVRLSSPGRVVRGSHAGGLPAHEANSWCRSASRLWRSMSWADTGMGLRPVKSLFDGSRPALEALSDAPARGQRWSEVRELASELVHGGEKAALPLMVGWLEQEGNYPLELAHILSLLRGLDPKASSQAVSRFLRHPDPEVRIQASFLLLAAGQVEQALPVISATLKRGPHHGDLDPYTVAEVVDALLANGSPSCRLEVERLFTDREPFSGSLGKVRPRVIKTLVKNGMSNGLRWYLRVLDSTNRFGFAHEVVENNSPDDPVLARIHSSTEPNSDQRVAAVKDWLRERIAHIEGR